jgi:ABC-type uncharacterized transport system substrate-binding protein
LFCVSVFFRRAERPAKFEPVINLKTAKAPGVTFKQSFLANADEVVE